MNNEIRVVDDKVKKVMVEVGYFVEEFCVE